MNLVYWNLTFEFEEHPTELLKRYCNEVVEELAKSEEDQDHFLLQARHVHNGDCRKTEEELKKEHSDLIDALYSNSIELFVKYFFGDELHISKAHTGQNCFVLYYEPEGWESHDVYGPPAEDEMLEFFGEFCTPKKTYTEAQILEDDYLPCRYVLMEDKTWKFIQPELTWDMEE